jgi:hypothetical protein
MLQWESVTSTKIIRFPSWAALKKKHSIQQLLKLQKFEESEDLPCTVGKHICGIFLLHNMSRKLNYSTPLIS